MSIRQFIGASSALLIAWLGVTFFHEVPAWRYAVGEAKTAENEAAPKHIESDVATTDSINR